LFQKLRAAEQQLAFVEAMEADREEDLGTWDAADRAPHLHTVVEAKYMLEYYKDLIKMVDEAIGKKLDAHLENSKRELAAMLAADGPQMAEANRDVGPDDAGPSSGKKAMKKRRTI
jgi:hypothetical protein